MPLRRKRSERLTDVLLMLPFFSLYCFALVRHQLWRDEINPWAIASLSQSLRELLSRVHYEAHPALWYIILYGASRISHGPWMLKVVQGAIAGGIFLLLTLTAPFRRAEIALILSGYYIAFQYTVMCRMYGLEVLFALCFVWFRMHRPEHMARNAIWLALLANVDVTGVLLAGGFLLEYSLERYSCQRRAGAVEVRQFTGAAAVFLGGSAISAVTLWPAKDIGWSATGKAFSLLSDGEHMGSAFARWIGLAWVPQTLNVSSLWPDPQYWPHAFLLPPLLVLFFIAFRRRPRMSVMLIAITLAGMAFSMVLNVGGIRHIGILYIGVLVAFWMMRFRAEPISPFLYVLFGLLVVSTGYAIVAQWGIPYADDDAAAQWMLQQHLEDMPLIGTPDTNIIGVPERLERPVYQLECRCVDRVLTFASRRDGFNFHTDVPERTIEAMQKLGGKDAILLENRTLTAHEQAALAQGEVSAMLLAKFDRGYVDDEHFFVYRLSMLR